MTKSTFSIKRLKASDWTLLLAYVLLSLFAAYHFIKPFLAERRYRDGYNFGIHKRYRYAIEELELAKKHAPWEPHYQVQLGKFYEDYAKQQPTLKQKRHYLDKAEKTYKNIIFLDKLNPWYRNRLAMLYTYKATLLPQESDYYLSLAEDNIKTAAKLDKKNPLFQLNYAARLHKKKDYQNAIFYYSRVIEYDPNIGEAFFNLADVYRSLGDYKKSLETYLQLYKRQPTFKNIHLALASTYISLNKKEMAIKHLEASLEQNKNQFEPLRSLAALYMQERHWTQAASTYSQLLARFPDRKEVRMFYVQSLLHSGSILEAESVLMLHLKDHPQDKKAQKQLKNIQGFIEKNNLR